MVDMGFSYNTEILVLGSAKFKSEILLQEMFEFSNISVYLAVTIKKSEKGKFFNSLSHFSLL